MPDSATSPYGYLLATPRKSPGQEAPFKFQPCLGWALSLFPLKADKLCLPSMREAGELALL